MTREEVVFHFGPFVLDVRERRLRREGEEVPLGGRAFDVLVVLVSRAGRLVTKDELLDEVWSELAVEENNLQVQVSSLRRALGPDWISTVPGRGYRFRGEVVPSESSASVLEREAELLSPAFVPVPTSPLVGRGADLDEVLARVTSQRLVTIAGPGGAGKTRLAQEVAMHARAKFAEGVAWVDLSGVTRTDVLAGSVASRLGVAVAGGDPAEALAHLLAPREQLLVLDNAEHVLEAVAALASRVLERAPAVRLLVTSQAPLRVSGEQVYRLAGLELPAADATADTAATSAAVELFVARARALVGDFRLDAAHTATVIEICRRLDGLPLAIELAVGRLPLLGLQELARRLEQRFRVLTAGSRVGPARQRTLEAMFDWSYELLAAKERAVFRRLALLRRAFLLDEMDAIVVSKEIERDEVIDILGDLVDRSLVTVDGGDPPAYSLLDSGRAYARTKLDPSEDEASIRLARLYYMSRANFHAGQGENAAALEFALTALEVVPFMAEGEGRDSQELQLDLVVGPVIQATLGPAHPRAGEIYRRASELAAKQAPAPSAFEATWGWWHYLAMCGRDREAGPCAEELVRLAERLGDPDLQLEAWHARLSSAQLLGDVAGVVEFAGRVTSAYVGERHHALGARFGGHDPGVCAWGQGAVGLWLSGKPDAAAERADRVLALGATMEDAYSRGVALFYAAFVFQMRGDLERFAATAADLHALCERHSMDMLSNEALLLRGRARWEAGDAKGLEDMATALDVIDAGGDFAFAIYYTSLLVTGMLGGGRLDDAERRLDRVAEYSREGQRFALPEAERLRGELLAARGREHEAAQHFDAAARMAAEDGAWSLALRAAMSVAEHAAPRERAAAKSGLRAVLERIEGGATTADIRRARALLRG